MNKLDELLNFNHQALNLRSQRQQVLASNIANADTPGYKARDFDFKSALATAVAQPATDQAPGGTVPARAPQPELSYRSVIQPSIDGNTVDMDVERAQFAENTVHFEANITMLTHQIRMMLAAIQG